ncbi:MAG: VWA domain-containing protein [Oligosphaeraceae bacterium]|nr:VWA domain-containing protein [Oligosphaeraceae bacterium]
MNGTWYDLHRLQLLWLLPVFAGMLLYATYRRRQALRLLLGSPMLPKLTASVSPGRRFLRSLLLLLAGLFIVLALARPAWNQIQQTIRREGRDVLFLLDVSRSMLADDLQPNRLERAKLAIDDCLQVLQGDRVALVVFAGNAVVRCPLTQDYGFFRMMLSDVSTDSVSRGGTLIGDALRKAANDVFDRQDRQYKDIVLITDGEDHESFPLEAAKAVGESGIRLIAVGLGDESGTPIVVPGEGGSRGVLKYQGEIVRSRLDSDTLRAMVNATPGGRYLPVATGNIDLDKVYLNLIASAAKREIESQSMERYEEKFQLFLLLALLCLVVLAVISDRRRLQRAVSLLLLLLPWFTQAESAEQLLRRGNDALAAKQYEQALNFYTQAALEEPESPYLAYNQGLVYFLQENYEQAMPQFKQAAAAARALQPPDLILASRCLLALGNAQYRECRRQEDSDLNKAKEACEKSILTYQEALRLRPSVPAAENNLKVARLWLKKLLNMLEEQRKQQQEQVKKMQEQVKKLQELADRQEQAAGNSRQAEQTQDNSPGTSERLQQEQQQISQETGELAGQRQAAPDDQVQKHLEQAQEKQQAAEQALEDKKHAQAAREQQEAAKSLRQAKEEMEKQQQQSQQQQGQEQQGQEQQQGQDKQQGQEQQGEDKQQGEGQDQSAAKDTASQEKKPSDEDKQFSLSEDAQEILDDERKNQRERMRRRQQSPRPVDKDW